LREKREELKRKGSLVSSNRPIIHAAVADIGAEEAEDDDDDEEDDEWDGWMKG